MHGNMNIKKIVDRFVSAVRAVQVTLSICLRS